jgi:RNA polymerase sigma-70 factor, ECF subfamily
VPNGFTANAVSRGPSGDRPLIHAKNVKIKSFRRELFAAFIPNSCMREPILMDDSELWQRIRQKDAAAFDVLYQSYGPRLRGFLKQLLGNGQAAEDVTQEAFVSIWQHPNGFNAELGTLRSYVFGVGRKRAVEWWRKQKPEGYLTTEAAEEGKLETQSLIGDAFRKLLVEHRVVLWLREVEGQSYEEISQIIGIPEGTVKSRLFAARKALREVWHATRRNEEGA